jgi:amino acid adenylation domain-containing protein
MSSQQVFPVSFAQQRLLFLDQLDSGTTAYNLSRVIRMQGVLDAGALSRTLNEVVRRHASLRTRFVFDSGEGYQLVEEAADFETSFTDVSHFGEADRLAEALRLAQTESSKNFNLSALPLFRSMLIRLDSRDHLLVLVMHHIVTDGWSMGVLFDEIGKIYAEFAYGVPAKLPVLPTQYPDFATWQREKFTAEALKSDTAYWVDKLKDHEGLLQIPADFPRPPIQSHAGALEIFQVGEPTANGLKRIAESQRASLFMVTMAAFQTLIWQYTGNEDILIGTPTAGRHDANLEKLIGFFTSTLVVRGNLAADPTFVQLLQRVRETTLEAYEHQDLPFEKLVEALKPQRSLNHTPLFQIMMVFQNAPKQILTLPGLSLEELEFDSGSSKFDLTLEIVEQDGLRCSVEYCTDLFRKQTIQRFAQHFRALLQDIVENPDRPISELRILDDAARNELIFDFNRTTAPRRRDARIDTLFAEQVERSPNRVALVEGGVKIEYRDLNERAETLASILVEKGCDQDHPVGIYMERSIDAVVTLLAAFKANAPIVPLDIANPQHRLAMLIRDAGCRVIVTHRGRHDALPKEIEAISLNNLPATSTVPSRPAAARSSEDLAYIIYTSGSTGMPKGVEGTHRAAINRFTWMWRDFPFTADETCCQKTALGFVDSIWEIFGPLLAGVRSIIVPEGYLLEPDQFVTLLTRHEVTRIVLVPSLLRTLLDSIPDLASRLPKLKLWTSSGEVLPLDLVDRFRTSLPEARLLNIYGSSEVTADATYYDATAGTALTSVPIGRPIDNTHVVILDRHKKLVPPLVAGEIHIGGDCLARGYWRQPDLTAQRFIPNPYRTDQSQSLFATGDLGRVLADGTLEYLGRADLQVKIRGIRIEPGEIEANLTSYPSIRQAAVVVHGESQDTKKLVAYLVMSESSANSINDIRDYLKARLPDYMIPAIFIPMESLPVLPSGKINRLALPSPQQGSLGRREQLVRPRNAIEEKLCSIWCEVLELDEVGIDDNFFDVGGHSLSGMRVLARVRRDLRVDIPIRRLFDHPTIGELAVEVARKAEQANQGTKPVEVSNGESSSLLDVLRTGLRALSSEERDALLTSLLAEKSAKSEQKL